jgi:hypothetical protein
MIRHFKLNLVIYFFFSFLFLILASIITNGWLITWYALKIPALLPPHFDLRFYQYPAMAIDNGRNPLFAMHEIWVTTSDNKGISEYFLTQFKLAHFLKFHKEPYFLSFAIFIIINYIYCCYKLLNIKKNSFWILILFFSSGSLLGIERTNNDLIIFILLYWMAMYPNILGIFFYLSSVIIEYWPAVTGITFIKKKIKILALVLIVCFFAYNLKAIFFNTPILNDWFSFGAKSTTLTINRFFLININYLVILVTLIIFTLISLLPSLNILKLEFKKEPTAFIERLFLTGSSIYIGLFILESNYDYKLIFIIFCVPYISLLKNKITKYSVLISMIVASNYTWMSNHNLNSLGAFMNIGIKCLLFIMLLNLLIRYIINFYKKYGIKKIFL